MAKRTRLQKLCYRPAYAVAIRRRADAGAPYRVKYPSPLSWYADPFVCADGGKTYVFVELMNSYHLDGEIAVASVEDGVIGSFRVVLHEPFHLSFPNIFLWEGTWYMIPETYAAGEVRLYRADSFPYRWSLDKVLRKGGWLVDHALYPVSDGFFMVSYDTTDPKDQRNRIFRLDMRQKALREIFPAGNWCRERPGGTFYQEQGIWHHAIQDCKKAYGDYLHIYAVDAFAEERFEEHEVRRMDAGNTPFSPDNRRMEHLHTYNCNAEYEVIDLQYDKLYPDKFFIHQWQEILKRIKRSKRAKRGGR